MYCHTVCHTHTFELSGMDHKIDKITMFRSYLGQTQYISFTTRLLVAIQVQGCTCTAISGYYAEETPLLVYSSDRQFGDASGASMQVDGANNSRHFSGVLCL